jgi:hypothetical protein
VTEYVFSVDGRIMDVARCAAEAATAWLPALGGERSLRWTGFCRLHVLLLLARLWSSTWWCL